MSKVATIELARELRAMAFAGVESPSRHRLERIAEALERNGGAAPVHARIAELSRRLLTSGRADAPAAFLQLNTLVRATLKAGASVSVAGEWEAVRCTTVEQMVRELGEGRHGAALERGVFGDPALLSFALEALDSPSPDVVGIAARAVRLPFRDILTELVVASIDLRLKRPAARPIEAIRRADPRGAARLAHQVLDPASPRVFVLRTEGVDVSTEAIVAALECLGDGDADRRLLAERLDARRKPVRMACLRRLLAMHDPRAASRAAHLLNGSIGRALEALEAMTEVRADATSDAVPALARRLLGDSGGSTKPLLVPAAKALRTILLLLVRSDPRPERIDVVLALLRNLPRMQSERVNIDDERRREVIDYLVVNGRAEERDALFPDLMRLHEAYAARSAIRRLGPTEALRLMRLGPSHLFPDCLTAIHGYRDDDEPFEPFESLAPDADDLPTDWARAWLEYGLHRSRWDVVERHWSLAPDVVIEALLARTPPRDDLFGITERLSYTKFVALALLIDPERAAEIEDGIPAGARFRDAADLCEAVIARNAERCEALITALRLFTTPDFVASLREVLAEHCTST